MSFHQVLATRLGYTFQNMPQLQLALTHRSYSGRDNNERLEFLGDSILNLVVGQALFEKFPLAREGQLSRLRASLVREETLAAVGTGFGLHEFIRVGPGELKTGGARRDSIVADAVEAIIGALYLEVGMDTCRAVVLGWFESRLQSLCLDDPIKDNKTRLQELLQAARQPLPEYRIVDVAGTAHAQMFRVECTVNGVTDVFRGDGASRRQAEQQAAGKALERVGCIINELKS